MIVAFLKGFGTSAGLIIAIGAQNAYVLSQGVKRNHHIPIALICSFFDALLITIGILGVGTAISAHPAITRAAAWGGAAFLLWYGTSSFRSAAKGGALTTQKDQKTSFKKAVLTTLAVTLLNPHVYLDTVILMGSISGQFPLPDRPWFGLGAALASFFWFMLLSLGGKAMAPVFKNKMAWRVLDVAVGLTMCTIAASLLLGLS